MGIWGLEDKISSFFSTEITHRRILLALALLALIVWLIVLTWPDHKLHLYFLDVGQGDSIFIRTPGNYKILVDGGPDNSVLEQLSGILPFYDRQIDLMILTHPHADHVTGLSAVLERYRVDKVVYNPVPYSSSEYQRFKDQVEGLEIERSMFTRGQKIELTDGVSLTCFWPLKQETFMELEDVNKASMVIRLDYSDFSSLLTADAEFGEIPQLDNWLWKPVAVLKVPHQGSRGAVTERALSSLRPKLAVISVGENKFGHPVNTEISKLEAAGAKVLRTDQNGTIEVVSDGERWYYRSEKWR
ncbi:hypothetical protein B5M47_00330 [candidate division CPR3 bacterium 4484_211]|uniref:Metallo-beta-lactamase domain-containing protein n=1 Tax=candidate division CPR3 bacterium 4484_211 TaxID=1968527 RepID=A0A1W9P194_UNCC3|nr:MAG: hypothetical protein B5M47_00330 [candidate division CPR3 bacterium 4484_211]